MKDIKAVVAQNLTILRKQKGLTQAELAEQFNYSDKAVCRWERGDTLPDINILYALCEFYGITMNDLVNPAFEVDEVVGQDKHLRHYRIWVCVLLQSVVWLCATIWFVTAMTLFDKPYWLAFIWAVPVACIVAAKTLKPIINWIGKTIIYSMLFWAVITAVYLHLLLHFDINIWSLFIVGLPLQVFVVMWNRVKRYRDEF